MFDNDDVNEVSGRDETTQGAVCHRPHNKHVLRNRITETVLPKFTLQIKCFIRAELKLTRSFTVSVAH